MLPRHTRLLAEFPRSSAARYGLCIGVVAVATLVRWLLNPILGNELPYIILYFALILISWLGGLGPAVLGVALGIVTADCLFASGRSAWIFPATTHDRVMAGLFAFIGIATGTMSGAYRRALARSEHAYDLSRRQQLELEQIYSSTPVGLGFLDEKLRYLRVNEALAKFNGIPAKAHPGKHISEVLSPANTQILTPLLMQVLTTNIPLTDMEFQGSSRPGSKQLRHVRASFYPVQLGGLKGIHGVVEDITAEKKAQNELRALEEQLRQAVKMEAIGRLAGGVAHDFNNLLMVISSYTELLLEELEDQPEYAKKLEAIAGATGRAARLIQQLLAFSRKQTMQPQIVVVDPLVANLEHLLRRLLKEDIELMLELRSAGARIKVDPTQLEQVLLNLALNARDAMAGGGRLAIYTSLRRFRAEAVRPLFRLPAGEYVEICVTDSGCGMSPEVQARVFDPFFTTKQPGQGTGLGLAMVYGIVRQSEGQIELSSAVGQGTTFRIWMPTTAQTAEQTTPEPPPLSRGSETILVVEDEAILRQAINESLAARGYNVLEASDGSVALALIENHEGKIDLLISDAVMPGMSGMDLIHRVRARYPAIKVILMSGYAQAQSIAGHTHDGPDADIVFLQKPFAHAELAKTIRRLLSHRLPT